MGNLRENKKCYASSIQRDVLLHLVSNPDIENSFFLTGGTALSVFYLHHRSSNDLDLFTLETSDFSEIDLWIRTMWPKESAKIKESPNFLSFLIRETKVDFVIDHLSRKEEREKVLFENGHYLTVDTVNNIVSNKFSTIVSRVEPKDFIDFYFILKTFPEKSFEEIYKNARLKDAIFDDPPTAAFQLEEGLASLKETPEIFPQTKRDFNLQELFEFYDKIVKWLYQRIKT